MTCAAHAMHMSYDVLYVPKRKREVSERDRIRLLSFFSESETTNTKSKIGRKGVYSTIALFGAQVLAICLSLRDGVTNA